MITLFWILYVVGIIASGVFIGRLRLPKPTAIKPEFAPMMTWTTLIQQKTDGRMLITTEVPTFGALKQYDLAVLSLCFSPGPVTMMPPFSMPIIVMPDEDLPGDEWKRSGDSK